MHCSGRKVVSQLEVTSPMVGCEGTGEVIDVWNSKGLFLIDINGVGGIKIFATVSRS